MSIWVENSKSTRFYIFAVLIAMLFIPVITNLKYSYDMFVHAIDFSIYQQAFYEIAAGNSFNPYLTIRDIKILNDHIDPIIYLCALWIKVFGESVSGLMVYEWLWFFLGGISLYRISLTERFSYKGSLFVLFLYVFSRGALQGVEFPIHTTTWSILPCIWTSYYLIKGDEKRFLFWFVFLCTFREIYYFCLFGLSVYFFLNKSFKKSFSYFLGFLFLAVFLIKIRPLLFGPTIDYGGNTKDLILKFKIMEIFKRMVSMSYPWQIFAPAFFLVPLSYIKSENKKEFKDRLFKVLLFILPGIGIHLIVGRMVHHHAIPFVMPMYVFLAFQKWDFLWKLKKIKIGLLCIFVILCASSRYTRMFKYIFNGQNITKINFSERRESFKKVKRVLEGIPLDSTIKATGSVIPFILTAGMQVYTIAAYSKKLESYDYLLMERNRQLIPYPLSHEQMQAIENRCANEASEILYEDFYYILMKGPIRQGCF